MNPKALTALLATLAMAGCTLAPDYQPPASPVPATRWCCRAGKPCFRIHSCSS